MDLQISHIKRSTYNVLVNSEFYVEVDLENSTIEDESNKLTKEDAVEVFTDTLEFHKERIEAESEESATAEKFGHRESDFL